MSTAGIVLLPGGLRLSAVLTSTPVAPGVTEVAAVVRRGDGTAPVLDRHLRARARGARPWPRLADVLTDVPTDVAADVPTGGRDRSPEGALRELARLRQQHPGALVTVVGCADRRCVVRLGPGTVLLLAPAPGTSARTSPPSPTVASLLHACLAAGIPPAALSRAVIETVRLGPAGDPGSGARGPRARLRCRPQPTGDGQDGSPTRSMPARSESGG
ncbi:hypothetical protein [Streptacidiphilus sp. P02-A3a]|uniref:hypothetical protein n=1 Tax=Streptacidiphilus sp. P02-A3a TaxID=2704468 RepID=UPI0015FD62E9|nr:hypothetical protein [Streptacidiphilus sp. P02-A3a]QMU71280.1 hypothetical protein GXP74_26700 [Streptacidiphilus sp. P02-A3a]